MKILVLSRNPNLYSTQSIVVAGRRRGHYMKVVDHTLCDIILDKTTKIFYQGEYLNNIDAIIPRIGASATYSGAAIIRHFELHNVFSALRSDALMLARDKLSCLQILSAHGVAIPRSAICKNLSSLDPILQWLGDYPLIIKMLNSTHGMGVLQAFNKAQATALYESYTKLRQKLMLQEFIEEAEGADIRVFVVDGKVVASMKRQAAQGEFRSNLHRGASSAVEYLSDKEHQLAIEASRILNLGVAGVDILRSRQGPLILEVNPSPGLEGIEGTTKVDIASRIIQYVERNARKR